jgi:hypothetical protein
VKDARRKKVKKQVDKNVGSFDKHNWMFAAYAVWKNTPQEVVVLT